jgi:hypothetical protein
MRTASKDRKKDYIKRNYFTSILIYIVPVSKGRKKGARTVWILWNELNEGMKDEIKFEVQSVHPTIQNAKGNLPAGGDKLSINCKSCY